MFRKSKKRYDKGETGIMSSVAIGQLYVFEVSKRSARRYSFYDLEELVEMQPQEGSCYVSSTTESFNEGMEIDYERLVNRLGHYGLPHYHVHVSGYNMPLQLKNVLKEISAEKSCPIHLNKQLYSVNSCVT
jgi:hypothetical protein